MAIEKVITKHNLHEQPSDAGYWQTRPYEERIAALEQIRREYNEWRYGAAEQRLQRVCRIIKRK